MIDAKDRKTVVKTLKEDMKEMFTNKMAHLFLIHILYNLDDTTLSKKKIITVRFALIIDSLWALGTSQVHR